MRDRLREKQSHKKGILVRRLQAGLFKGGCRTGTAGKSACIREMSPRPDRQKDNAGWKNRETADCGQTGFI